MPVVKAGEPDLAIDDGVELEVDVDDVDVDSVARPLLLLRPP